MKKLPYLFVTLAVLSVVFMSCSRQDAPVVVPFADTQLRPTLGMPVEVTLAGFDIAYLGKFPAGANSEFRFGVSRDGAAQIGQFYAQIPDCAELVGFSPQGASIHVDEATGRSFVKWGFSLTSGESRTFSYTFAGDVEEGLVFVRAKESSVDETGVLVGPCGGYFVTGAVFTDADANTFQSAEELGIPNVTVDIHDSDGAVESQLTNSSGNYSFLVIDGDYTVEVRLSTPEVGNDFNETLGSSYTPTTALSIPVSVPPDRPGTSFGFEPDATAILAEFQPGGDLTTIGEGDGFWRSEIRSASHGRAGKTFLVEDMQGFVGVIRGLHLIGPGIPFELPGDGFNESLALIPNNPKTDWEELVKVVLIAEYNWAAGFRMNDEALQEALIAWGESLIVENAPASASGVTGTELPALAPPGGGDGGLRDAIDIFDAMNGGGGGGGGTQG
jgi:hypothetical protein